MPSSKFKIILTGIVGLIFGIGVLVFVFLPSSKPAGPQPLEDQGAEKEKIAEEQIEQEVQPQYYDNTSLPEGFLPDIISKPGIEFIQSYKEEYVKENYTHLFVSYYSVQSYALNQNYFSRYLADNNWTILKSDLGDEGSQLDAVKGGDGLRIVILPTTPQVEVNISFRKNGSATLQE